MNDPVNRLRAQLLELRQLHASGLLDEATLAASSAGLERALLDAVLAAPATRPPPQPGARRLGLLAVLVAGIGGLAYAALGAPGVAESPPAGFEQAGADTSPTRAPHALGRSEMEALVEQLATRLKANPADAEGWAMLGRSYSTLQRNSDAIAAYRQALQLRPDDAALLADLADALAVAGGRSLEGEAGRLVERALALDPDQLKALALAGTAAFNRGDHAGALRHWERAVRVGPADSPLVAMAREGVADARERGGLSPAAPAAAASSASSISGRVTLAPALLARASPNDTVFVFARPASGAGMPLAILRRQVRDLPLDYTLDDSHAMSPAARLSGADAVVVGARISKSGQAAAAPGDLEGSSGVVKPGAKNLAIEIASTR